MGRGNTQKIGNKSVFRCRPPKTDFRFLIYTPRNIYLKKKKHGLKPKNSPDLSDFFFRFRCFFRFFYWLFLTICLILGFSPHPKTPDSPRVPPLSFSIKNEEKIGFPMPTAKNRFQFLIYTPKKHTFKKKNTPTPPPPKKKKNMVLKEKFTFFLA